MGKAKLISNAKVITNQQSIYSRQLKTKDLLILGTAIFLILVITDFSKTSTTGAKSTTSGLERTEFTTETITTTTEESATNTPEPSGTLNDFSSARCIKTLFR